MSELPKRIRIIDLEELKKMKAPSISSEQHIDGFDHAINLILEYLSNPEPTREVMREVHEEAQNQMKIYSDQEITYSKKAIENAKRISINNLIKD